MPAKCFWICREWLQYTSQNGDVLVPLWEDLDWLKRYIGIMQKRYQDQFEVSMDIPEYLRSLEVPKLFLQAVCRECHCAWI